VETKPWTPTVIRLKLTPQLPPAGHEPDVDKGGGFAFGELLFIVIKSNQKRSLDSACVEQL